MSFWSTLANIFRTRQARRTPVIILRLWQDGGAINALMVLPHELAETTQVCGNEALQDGTLKYLEPQSITMLANGDRSYRFRLLFSPQNLSPASGGSPEPKPRDCYGNLVEPYTFEDSFSLGSIPAHDRWRSSP